MTKAALTQLGGRIKDHVTPGTVRPRNRIVVPLHIIIHDGALNDLLQLSYLCFNGFKLDFLLVKSSINLILDLVLVDFKHPSD